MQTARLVQAVIVMLIVALAASCAATKKYSSKLFVPRTTVQKDSQVLALRFLEINSDDKNTEDWVNTDNFMGRDSITNTTTLDNLAKNISSGTKKDSMQIRNSDKAGVIITQKTDKTTDEPVAKTTSPDGVRSKKTREE